MKKKKSSKEPESKSFNYSVELNGLLLILIGLIGFGNFGPVGRIIKNFVIFLMGSWYLVLLFLLVALGAFMIIKRKMPKFFSSRLIGFYILLLSILVFSHIEYINDTGLEGKEIFKATLDSFMNATNSSSSNIGGGIIGASLAVGFKYLFDTTGSKIVVYVLMGFGSVMLLDITLSDIFEKLGLGTNWLKKKLKVSKKEGTSDDEDSEEDDKEVVEDEKIIITSVDQLKSNPKVEQENVAPKPISENRMLEEINYQLPPLSLLDDTPKQTKTSTDFVKNNKNTLEKVLVDFGVKGRVVEIHVGPSVTQFEVKIEAGTKVSKIVSIKD